MPLSFMQEIKYQGSNKAGYQTHCALVPRQWGAALMHSEEEARLERWKGEPNVTGKLRKQSGALGDFILTIGLQNYFQIYLF